MAVAHAAVAWRAGVTIRPHHQRAIQRLVEHFRTDPHCLEMIVGGSVARGWASDDSDVRVMLVVTDEEFARRLANGDLGCVGAELADYPGGYGCVALGGGGGLHA